MLQGDAVDTPPTAPTQTLWKKRASNPPAAAAVVVTCDASWPPPQMTCGFQPQQSVQGTWHMYGLAQCAGESHVMYGSNVAGHAGKRGFERSAPRSASGRLHGTLHAGSLWPLSQWCNFNKALHFATTANTPACLYARSYNRVPAVPAALYPHTCSTGCKVAS